MHIVLKAVAIVAISASAFAADKPDLKVASGLPKLAVSFKDADVWNGKRWLRVQQCRNNGGVSPVMSPSLKVSGAPPDTKMLVVFFNNAKSMHNHGLYSFQAKSEDGNYSIPAVATGTRDKLPDGIALFQGGSSWGSAFSAPCPTNHSWKYTVMVYAVNEQEQVVATQEIDVGWSE